MEEMFLRDLEHSTESVLARRSAITRTDHPEPASHRPRVVSGRTARAVAGVVGMWQCHRMSDHQAPGAWSRRRPRQFMDCAVVLRAIMVTSKQVYASHYLNAALTVVALTGPENGRDLVYVHRSHVNALEGPFGA